MTEPLKPEPSAAGSVADAKKEQFAVFRLTEEGRRRKLERTLRGQAVTGVLLLAGTGAFLYWRHGTDSPGITVGVLVFMALLVARSAYVQARAMAEGFELRLSDTDLSVHWGDQRRHHLPRERIGYVVEGPAGLIAYPLDVAGPAVRIPEGLEGFEAVRSTLSAWAGPPRPTQPVSAVWVNRVAAAGAALYLMAFAVMYTSADRGLALACAVYGLAYTTFAVWQMSRSEVQDAKLRALSTWVLLLTGLLLFGGKLLALLSSQPS